MKSSYDIIQYLKVCDNTCSDLSYLFRLLNIHNVFTVQEIKTFYMSYSNSTSDMRVNGYMCVSINYGLVHNKDLMSILDDDFFILLLSDYDDTTLPDIELERRLVHIINKKRIDSMKLYSYINNFKNDLQITEKSLKYVVHDITYIMKYNGCDINIIKMILRQISNDTRKYIYTQGCINNIILYSAMCLNYYNFLYVSNINITDCKKLVCYNHIDKIVKNNVVIKRYFRNSKDISVLIKHADNMNINEAINACIKKYGNVLTEEDISVLCHRNIKPSFRLYDLMTQVNNSNADTEMYQDMQRNKKLKIVNIYSDNKTSESNYICKENPVIQTKMQNDKNTDKETTVDMQRKVYETQYTQNLPCDKRSAESDVQHSKYTSADTPRFKIAMDGPERITKCGTVVIATNHDEKVLNNDEARTRKNGMTKDVPGLDTVETMISDDINSLLEALASDMQTDTIIPVIDELFKHYELNFLFDFMLKLIDKHPVIIEKIQKYVIKVLETGFFEEHYFDIISKIHNKIVRYNRHIEIRKKNDKILLMLSKYCKYFDKTLHVGTVKTGKHTDQ